MKKIFLLVLMSLTNLMVFSQDPTDSRIIDNWFLHDFIKDGISYVPDHLTVNLPCDFLIDEGYPYAFYFPNESTLETFEVIYHESGPQFMLGESVGLTLGYCFTDACQDYFAIYSPFYFTSGGNWFTYEVIDNPDTTKTLIVTNVDGDQAIYNTDPLLGLTTFELANITVFPNPVSETLLISAENTQIETFSVFTITGQKILEQQNIDNTIDVSVLPQGIYFLQVFATEGNAIKKFIKK